MMTLVESVLRVEMVDSVLRLVWDLQNVIIMETTFSGSASLPNTEYHVPLGMVHICLLSKNSIPQRSVDNSSLCQPGMMMWRTMVACRDNRLRGGFHIRVSASFLIMLTSFPQNCLTRSLKTRDNLGLRQVVHDVLITYCDLTSWRVGTFNQLWAFPYHRSTNLDRVLYRNRWRCAYSSERSISFHASLCLILNITT